MHAAVKLWLGHRRPPNGYPEGVAPIPRPIVGTAFFPGGFGLWNPNCKCPLPRFPVEKVMVTGQDFDTKDGYGELLSQGYGDINGPTWRNLLALLGRHHIPPQDCFFTNFYMGLREQEPSTGVFPGAGSEDFVRFCSGFLIKQISVQRPRLILTLGKEVPPLIGGCSNQLSGWVMKGCTFRRLDAAGPVQANVKFSGIPDFSTTVVALVHPSYPINVRHRNYRGQQGENAERLMIEDGIGLAGL